MFEWCYKMEFTPSQFAKWYRAHELKEADSSTIAAYTDYILNQAENNKTKEHPQRFQGAKWWGGQLLSHLFNYKRK